MWHDLHGDFKKKTWLLATVLVHLLAIELHAYTCVNCIKRT